VRAGSRFIGLMVRLRAAPCEPVLSRLGGLDPALEDAAMDLGATYPVTLRRVVLPLMARRCSRPG